jgi:tetratricopeptide (TPR) repeat protein
LLAGLAAVILTVAVGAYLNRNDHGVAMTAHSGRSVAFVGFNNLSKNPKDAWLAPALSEMLAVELNVADDLRVIPDELVRESSPDLSPPAAGGYSNRTLADLQRSLDADYVISGSYLVSGTSEDPPLRVDVTLQEARTGKLLASISKQTVLSELLQLVGVEGSTLRGKLSVNSPDADALSRVANAQPPSVDVARRLGFALDALQHYDYARARDELLETVAEAPGFAPAYSYLADAWGALGYRDKALAAAEQAAQHAANLPGDQRLRIEAVVDNARGDWPKAVQAWHSLSQLKPLDLESRLRLVDAQIASGAITAAKATQHELSQLPDATSDPRVELAAARVAASANDPKGSEAHAAKALEIATRRDAVGLVAEARLALGGAQMLIGKNEAARSQFLTAIEAYRSIRNPRREAVARTNLAESLANLHLNQEAREEYQRAMSLEQSIGDLSGQAGVYRQLSAMLWLAGDRDGAQAAAHHALELARETGDLATESWSVQALATVESDDSASDAVIAEYREVVALYTRAGHDAAWPLTNIADLQRMRGELTEATATCEEARAQALTLSDPQFAIFSGFTCALIEMDRGHSAEARAGFEAIIRQVGKNGDSNYRDDSLMMLAQLDMDDRKWKAAEGRLLQASNGFAAAEARTGEADSAALLALTEHELGDSVASEKALTRARTLRTSMTSHQEVYMVDIALLALQGTQPTDAAAQVGKLLELADDAARRHFLSWSLEAKLMALDLLSAQHLPTATALRSDIDTIARRHGFGRVLHRLVSQNSPNQASQEPLGRHHLQRIAPLSF